MQAHFLALKCLSVCLHKFMPDKRRLTAKDRDFFGDAGSVSGIDAGHVLVDRREYAGKIDVFEFRLDKMTTRVLNLTCRFSETDQQFGRNTGPGCQ